ncbi:MAG: NAD-dependent epimerase/dehydratase family protein, partial [Candidatus Hydrogenedentes bacterium]|nr:NAD-dependent epimerase/dehydratase family protein [Candidatus Hydrogenedentota bacterium]
VYGPADATPLHEDRPCAPMSPYAVSKYAVEHYARVFTDLYGIVLVGLRFFNVFGPRQDPDSPYAAVVPLFIRALRAGRAPTVFGDGKQSRDFTYIDNVVDAIVRAMDAPGPANGAYNVACGSSTTVLELVRMINDIMGTNIEPAFAPARPGEIPWSLADIAKARAAFGYAPAIGVREGLARTVEWALRECAAP